MPRPAQNDERWCATAAGILTSEDVEGFLLDAPQGWNRPGNQPFTWRDGALMFGRQPRSVFEARPGEPDPLERLDAFLAPLEDRSAAIAVGFISYDLADVLEPTAASHKAAPPLPLVYMALYDEYYEYEPSSCLLWRCGPGGRRVLAEPLRPAASPAKARRARSGRSGVESDFTPEAYKLAVAAAREYILAGDIFEVNLSQRFTSRLAGSAGDLYMRLRRENRAPYSALLSYPHGVMLSTSPELFLRIEGDRIVTRPIKGTIRRRAGERDDARAADELRRSEKDNAELAMVIDLERNDLGRVCRYGSVAVTERSRVETFAHVHHLVSTVEGRLRDGVSLGDVLRATFPGGSITGAPKVRAMQIIDELEPCRRGVYTGAIGYVLPGRRAEFNIAIRTAFCRDGLLSFHVGGAVTADSRPSAEYDETLAKAEGILAALDGVGAPCATVGGEAIR